MVCHRHPARAALLFGVLTYLASSVAISMDKVDEAHLASVVPDKLDEFLGLDVMVDMAPAKNKSEFAMAINSLNVDPGDSKESKLVFSAGKDVSLFNKGDGTLVFEQEKEIATLYGNGSFILGKGSGPHKLMIRAQETWLFETAGRDFRFQKSSGADWHRYMYIREDGAVDVKNEVKAVGVLADSLNVQKNLKGAKSLYRSGVKQWTLLVHQTFEEASKGWIELEKGEPVPRQACGGVQIIGGPCKISSQTISSTFTGLPAHSRVRIKAMFHFIDRWNGESGWMKVNDRPVWQHLFRTGAGSDGVNICGDKAAPEDQFTNPIDVVVDHTSGQLALSFGSSLEGSHNACQASYAISSVQIFYM